MTKFPDVPELPTVVTSIILRGGTAIVCLVCKTTSSHPQHVAAGYCLKCQRFHEEMAIDLSITLLEAYLAGVPPDSIKLLCQDCGAEELVKLDHFTQVYKAMNELGWALIPTQHGSVVSGLCPKCEKAPRKLEAGAL